MAAQSFAPREVFSKVELSLSCENLKDLDHFSKSDPAVFIYQASSNGDTWVLMDKTEVIDNNLNPKFAKTILMNYQFEEIQKLKFVVYDIDDKKHLEDTSKHDLIGQLECTLADIVTAGQEYKRTLRAKGATRGKIVIRVEEVQDSKFNIEMHLTATKLDKKDFFGKSDPFFEIAKSQEGGTFTEVYRSEPKLKTLDPIWPSFSMSIQRLCSGDWDRVIKFTVWDWNKSGDHDYIGSCTATLREICPERGGQVYNLAVMNEEKKKKKKYTSSGTLNFKVVRATPEYSFMDFVRGGCQINMQMAVDFTASNGNPQESSSLHYNNPYSDNEYVQAIKSVASVLAPYDSDQLIPAFGFGGRLPPNGDVSHCFPLNSNFQKPEVYGVQGILDAYHYTLSQVQLYGPTNFSTFLDKIIESCQDSITQDSQSYNILLVITDGEISDMSRTTDRIVAASKLPLSIVIVGVGGADFTKMEVLDADDNPLANKYGEKMTRDIVQFVPLRQFKSKGGADFSLARETLAEIPGQLTSFMKANGLKPNPPPLRTRHSVNLQDPTPPGVVGATPPYPTDAPAGQPPYPL
ncbi:copine-9-like isoform X1 [Halichondria panicea]|uniref:copine-9-like isoform X1 n=1 Tax=Halichondria panicea TaxID=6063 RepID=UPI00312B2D99